MPELRLIDPDGYTVPGTAQTVPDTDIPAVRARLLAEVAPQHAAQWADFGYQATAYRVLPDPPSANELLTVTSYHNQYDSELRFLGKIVVGSRVTRGYSEFASVMEFFRSMADTDYILVRPAAHWNDKDA